MIRKTMAATLAVLFGLSMMATSMATAAMAQGTPAASPADCPSTTPEENIQIIEDYFDAVVTGDVEAADALLHEDLQHNLEHPDVPESADVDVLENIDIASEVNHDVTHVVAQDDWVAIYKNFEVSGEHIPGADPELVVTHHAMAMARVECGVIVEALIEMDTLALLQAFGYEIHPPEGE